MKPSKLPLKAKMVHILIGLPFAIILIILSLVRFVFTIGALVFMSLDSRVNYLSELLDMLYFLAISPFNKDT
jgi:hypothetical protein